MSEIKLLSENVINQIAAGEVIERPASVVKELVENAIDAKSTEILIDILDGGKKYIRISDNGTGIKDTFVKKAFLRHATSKFSNINDFNNLHTLGFRGEALASIASVANVRMTTSTSDRTPATMIELSGGEIKKYEGVAGKKGTTIIVKDLFFNTPARKHYLKSTSTEMGHILDIVTYYALSNPQVSFSLTHNQKEVFCSPKSGDIKSVILDVYGSDIAKNLVPVSVKGKAISISGFVGNPTIALNNRSRQITFVNGRPVRNATIFRAITEAFKPFIPLGRQPVVFLFIEIDPKKVDVNVHPTKKEVKFAQSQDVYKTIYSTISDSLGEDIYAPELKPEKKKKTKSSSSAGGGYISSIPSPSKISFMPKQKTLFSHLSGNFSPGSFSSSSPAKKKKSKGNEKKEEWIHRGTLFSTYLIFEDGDDVVLLDQHVASERIWYERLSKALSKKKIETQELLGYIVLDLGTKGYATLESSKELFSQIGFVIEPFGKNTMAVKHIPVILGKTLSDNIIKDIFMDIASSGTSTKFNDFLDDIVKRMACRTAIKAGKDLNSVEIETLLIELFKCDNPNNCPHGRPVMIRLPRYSLEKQFYRKV